MDANGAPMGGGAEGNLPAPVSALDAELRPRGDSWDFAPEELERMRAERGLPPLTGGAGGPMGDDEGEFEDDGPADSVSETNDTEASAVDASEQDVPQGDEDQADEGLGAAPGDEGGAPAGVDGEPGEGGGRRRRRRRRRGRGGAGGDAAAAPAGEQSAPAPDQPRPAVNDRRIEERPARSGGGYQKRSPMPEPKPQAPAGPAPAAVPPAAASSDSGGEAKPKRFLYSSMKRKISPADAAKQQRRE